MKEHPILFNGEMVKAILEGRKTQTRRVCKQIPAHEHLGRDIMQWGLSGVYRDGGKWWLEAQTAVDDCSHTELHCPYGEIGDRLWVRETWCMVPLADESTGAIYKADGEDAFFEIQDGFEFRGPWRPSIHMPRWASRITLEITDIRVQRLHEISEEDAITEGVTITQSHVVNANMFAECRSDLNYVGPHQQAFCELWDSINAKRGFGWDVNPWVWVIHFERIK